MANKEAGERRLELGDKVITLKFNMNAYCELEDILGYGTGELGLMLNEGKWGFSMIRAMIFAGSRKYHRRDPELQTLIQVGDYMDEVEDLQELMRPTMEAYQAGQPVPSNPDEPDAEEASGAGQGKATSKAKGKKPELQEVSG